MKNITIKMIADKMNLSVATISKALRDSYEISEQTKERVRQYAKEMNYTTNPYASSLRRKKSQTIAVVVPEVADSFFALAINGIQQVSSEKGYHLLAYFSNENAELEEKILHEMGNGRIDGLLISVSSQTKQSHHIENLINQYNLPIVMFDRIISELNIPKIRTDDFQSTYKATELLIEKGCKNLIFFRNSSHLTIMQERKEGFYEAITSQHKTNIKGNDYEINPRNRSECLQMLRKVLTGRWHPDGILSGTESFVLDIYETINELKYKVPEELKIISFSNLKMAPILSPALTTITQPAYEMGKEAAKLLFKKIEKKKNTGKPETIVMPSVIIERAST